MFAVTSETASVSINVWSPSMEQTVYDALAAVKLPFDRDWPPEVFMTAVRIYVRLLIGRIVEPSDASVTAFLTVC